MSRAIIHSARNFQTQEHLCSLKPWSPVVKSISFGAGPSSIALTLGQGRRWNSMWGSDPGCLYPFWMLTLAMRTKQGQRAHFCGACDPCIHPAFYAFIQVPGTLEFSTQQPKPNSSLLRFLARSVSPKVHYTSGGGGSLVGSEGVKGHTFGQCVQEVWPSD